MVSDSELVGSLREFLRSSDLNTTTAAIVRRQLEDDFGIDLSDKKAFIRQQIDLYLESQLEKDEENDEDDDANDEDDDDDGGFGVGEAASKVKSEEEEEEEEEETSNDQAAAKRRGSKKQNKDVKKRGGGFTKLCSLSPELQKFVGFPQLARTEVVKQLWGYIREKNLQDPSNKRNIICDDTLHALFGVGRIDMFQMNKALTKHIWPLDSDNDTTFINLY